MKGNIRLFLKYIKISLNSQLQFKTSFILQILGNMFMHIIGFAAILVLFDRFKRLQNWLLPEVVFFYGFVNIIFSISIVFFRTFHQIGTLIKSGDFDRVLLRPRSIILQLMGMEFTINRIGRALQGVVVLVWALFNLSINWSPAKLLFLPYSLAAGFFLFAGMSLAEGAMTFRTVETLEIMNIFTYGGVETARFPLSIYKPAFRDFFTYIIPLGCISYYPILTILESPLHKPHWPGWFTPLVGFLFYFLMLLVWKAGIGYYKSTGS